MSHRSLVFLASRKKNNAAGGAPVMEWGKVNAPPQRYEQLLDLMKQSRDGYRGIVVKSNPDEIEVYVHRGKPKTEKMKALQRKLYRTAALVAHDYSIPQATPVGIKASTCYVYHNMVWWSVRTNSTVGLLQSAGINRRLLLALYVAESNDPARRMKAYSELATVYPEYTLELVLRIHEGTLDNGLIDGLKGNPWLPFLKHYRRDIRECAIKLLGRFSANP